MEVKKDMLMTKRSLVKGLVQILYKSGYIKNRMRNDCLEI